MLCGISTDFPVLSPTSRQVAHVLLTRPPLRFLWHSILYLSFPLCVGTLKTRDEETFISVFNIYVVSS